MEARPVRCPGCGRPFSKGGSNYWRTTKLDGPPPLSSWMAECGNCGWYRKEGPYWTDRIDPRLVHAGPSIEGVRHGGAEDPSLD